MVTGPEWLQNVFMFAFLFGLVFTVASIVLGVVDLGGLDLNGDGQIDIGGNSGEGLDGPGIFNLPTVMAFFTWFGGAGYILMRFLGFGGFIAVPLALASGVLGALIMFGVLARLLWPMMSKPLSKADFHLPGTPARVVSSIREGGVGEIVYSKAGSRFTAGARSLTGEAVPKGAEVVIVRYERGLAYVQPVEELLRQEGGEARSA